ncbi:prepilin peptidase [Oculatella sp. LEGE 06141]|uniref:prepilin peptidase n=1 Tax=Oculatella sp. LEGE 06141 TaxID=1828648 RepID=UPI00187FAED5|nr:A24 family peptidase [Oculatella sp. LEGE 06141]MBE9181201.1 prepilin peptidase [Oculatella sp. LEGE 06141]
MDLLYSGLASLFVFMFGICIGSFLNVVIYRIPAGLSLLFPPSRCPKCLHRLSKHDNVPVFGWLWLRGRCRYCKTPIPVRYPIIEATTGMLFLLVFWSFNLPLPAIGFWAFLSWLLALSLIDLDTMTLPNSLTKSGLAAGLVFQAALGWTETSSVSGVANRLMVGILGAVIGVWLFDLITLLGSIAFGQTAMGGGDAKLAGMIGAWLGWKYLLLTGFLACAIGAFAGGGAMAIGLLDRRQPMPFGPFLAIGAALAVFFGDAIISTYVHTFFPTL